ncbi:MAG TPA: hypothetical protein VK403_05470 [Allosphingosinicella sp.]|nr:hypothetical protein [Allosphingosinicella sp.]
MNAIDFVVQLPFSWRQQRVQAQRNSVSRERFIAALANNEIEVRAAGHLWDKLREIAVVRDFRPCPEDDFLHLYGLADEDLDEDVILAILTVMEREPPSPAALQRIGKIRSPREFMQLFQGHDT